MRATVLALAAAILAGCATQSRDQGWVRHDIDISGKRVSISAPPGDVTSKTVLSTRLGGEEVLLSRFWIFARAGGVNAHLFLKTLKHPSNGNFFAARRANVLDEVRRHFPKAEVTDVATRSIGGRQWICYVVTVMESYSCVLDIDGSSFLMWRADWVPNFEHKVPAQAKAMIERLEASIEVAF